MNICIVSNFKQSGYGESTRPGQMAKHLKQFGHSVLHICDWEGTENGIKHINIDRDNWEPNPIKRVLAFAGQYITVNTFRPDIIYAHQFNNARWALQTKLFKGIPVVFDAHTCKYFEHVTFKGDPLVAQTIKQQEGYICNHTSLTISASAETGVLLQQYYHTPPDKIKVVGNATTIKPAALLTHSSTNKFTCIATLPQDGFAANEMALNMLLDIAAEVYKHNPAIEFYVVGGGKMPAAKSPNVTFTGYVKDLRLAIENATVCLMPFPNEAVCGGARNKFCDYIALGKAVITTTEGLRGMEVMEHNKNCLVADSTTQFAHTILNAAQNSETLYSIEKNAFALRNYYNWEDRAKKVETIFKALLQK